MRSKRYDVWMAPLLCLAMLAGCRTTDIPTAPPSLPAEELTLSERGNARAEAMALFSEGLIKETRNDLSGAYSNYLAALQLDADNEFLYLRIARRFLQYGQYESAADVLEEALKTWPESTQALSWLAICYQHLELIEQLEDTFKKLIAATPEDAVGYVELASLYIQQGRDSDAVNLLKKSQNKVEDKLLILQALGNIYLQKALDAEKETASKTYREEAIKIFEDIAEQYPDDMTIRYQLGDLYILDDQVEQAISVFEEIEQQIPDNLQVKKKLALSFVANGNNLRAIETLEDIAGRQSDNPRIYYYLGELYEQLGETNKAIEKFEASIYADPQEPTSYLKIALLELDANPQRAINILQDGLKTISANPALTEMLAYVYQSQEDFKNAYTYFTLTGKTIDEDEGAMASNFYFNYAVTAQQLGKKEETARLLARAMSKTPSYLEIYMQYIFQYEESQPKEFAVDVLEQVAKLRPNDPNVYIDLGSLYSYLQQYEQAIATFEKAEAIALNSDAQHELLTDAFYFWYGAACERNKQYDRAEKMFNKSLELNPENGEAYNYLAYMWADMRTNLVMAREYIDKALELKPENGAFIDTLGWIYYQEGDYSNALKEISKAAEIIKNDPVIMEHQGDIYEKLGDITTAIEKWKGSFQLDPSQEKVINKLKEHDIDIEQLQQQLKEQKKQKELEEGEMGKPTDPLPPMEEDVDILSPTNAL